MMYCLNVIETYFQAIRIAKQSDAVVSIKSEKTLIKLYNKRDKESCRLSTNSVAW